MADLQFNPNEREDTTRMTHNSYVMIGAGGTGTHLLAALCTYLEARYSKSNEDWMLHIMDGDVVEMKNLERQLFTAGHITTNKAVAAASMLNNPDHVYGTPEYLSEDNMERYIRDGDTVFICADNFTVRKRIEDHARKLDNVVVINGGNEQHTGSVQIWVRQNKTNVTPRIGYAHPEIAVRVGDDRAEMTCVQAAALPGGEQILIANMMTATWMLAALWRHHNDIDLLELKYDSDTDMTPEPGPKTWTELHFDVREGTVDHIDQRLSPYWDAT